MQQLAGLLVIISFLVTVYSCTKNSTTSSSDSVGSTQIGVAPEAPDSLLSNEQVDPSKISVLPYLLSDDEKSDLIYLREEEKLARDVYITLGEKYKLNLFFNIVESESRHMQAVLNLIEKYQLIDPAYEKAVGEFINKDLQNLYLSLVNKANTQSEALLVGALIEETDIRDLQQSLNHTSQSEIRTVYTNLMCGSRNHLRAFVSNYQKTTGNIYKAQVLSQEEAENILNSVDFSCN